jgi:hypothetical protein
MNAAGAGGGQANAQSSGVFGIAASGEGRRFLMSHLNEPELILVGSQRGENSVHAIAGESENGVDTPLDQPLN